MPELPNLPDIPEKTLDKLPTAEQWKKYGVSAVQYSFMILFVLYLGWNEWSRKSQCSDQIETLGKVIEDKDRQIKMINERVRVLEEYVYIQNGVIKKVEDKVVETQPNEAGGSK